MTVIINNEHVNLHDEIKKGNIYLRHTKANGEIVKRLVKFDILFVRYTKRGKQMSDWMISGDTALEKRYLEYKQNIDPEYTQEYMSRYFAEGDRAPDGWLYTNDRIMKAIEERNKSILHRLS